MVGFLPLLIEEVRTQGAREAIHRFAHVVYVLLPGLVFGYLIMGLVGRGRSWSRAIRSRR